MTALHIRGDCPRLAEPMQTGDGLLARLRIDFDLMDFAR